MKYEVVIVGAGPAGLAAAKELANNKVNVLVLEKNRVIGPKVCAGGLTTKDFKLGVDKKIADRFFNKVILHTPLFEDEIVDKKPFVATVSRKKLGQYMAKKTEKEGAKIRIGVEVVEIGKNYIRDKSGKKINFDYLIGADGSNSIVRRRLDLEKEDEYIALQYLVKRKFKEMEFFFDANLFGSGYAWIFPHRNFTSIGCGADTKKIIDSETLQKNFDKWLKDNKIKIDKNDKFESWFINYDYQGHDFDNIFLTGDAAGFPSGLTGEGMYFAMVSGIDIAKKIINPNYRQDGIKRILDIKKKHEEILSLMNFNKLLTEVEYNTLGLILKSRLLDKYLIDNFG